MSKDLTINPPADHVNSARYDDDCQSALADPLDGLIDQAVQVGWNRGRVASALMYLAAKRLTTGAR